MKSLTISETAIVIELLDKEETRLRSYSNFLQDRSKLNKINSIKSKLTKETNNEKHPRSLHLA